MAAANHPQQTTTATGQATAAAAAAEQQQAREDRCEDDETAPHEQSSVPCNERGSSRRALGTEETANGLPPSPERGPENRKITSNVTSHVLPFPSPIARDIIMSHVPIFGS